MNVHADTEYGRFPLERRLNVDQVCVFEVSPRIPLCLGLVNAALLHKMRSK